MNNRNNLFNSTTFVPGMLLLLLAGMSACKSSRENLTNRLFMQYKQVGITHVGKARENGARVVGEQVNYTLVRDNAGGIIGGFDNPEEQRLDTNKLYEIPEVVVMSAVRFTPVREGMANFNFVINVPKELLSDDFRVRLTPKLLLNDTIISLDDVTVTGKSFAQQQEEAYAKYEEYQSGIIGKEDYSKHFLDVKNVHKDMQYRQNRFREIYQEEFRKMSKYEEWYQTMSDRYAHFNTLARGNRQDLYHAYQRKGNLEAVEYRILDKDTAGISDKYAARSERKANRWSAYNLERELKLPAVPYKYRNYFLNKKTLADIRQITFNKEDSIQIASHRFLSDEIARNEMKEERKDEMFRRLVPFPRLEHVRYDVEAAPEHNFSYTYSQKYPVTVGMKRVRLILSGNVDATDRSRYVLPRTDTLTYLISSLEELADLTLTGERSFASEEPVEEEPRAKKPKNSREINELLSIFQNNAASGSDVVVTGKSGGTYAEGIRLLQEREYVKAIAILEDYQDYNTALCLTCLGYDEKAYNILEKQRGNNANVYYLRAISGYRLKLKSQAVDDLLEACKLDPMFVQRADYDPEISALVYEYGLQSTLDELM